MAAGHLGLRYHQFLLALIREAPEDCFISREGAANCYNLDLLGDCCMLVGEFRAQKMSVSDQVWHASYSAFLGPVSRSVFALFG